MVYRVRLVIRGRISTFSSNVGAWFLVEIDEQITEFFFSILGRFVIEQRNRRILRSAVAVRMEFWIAKQFKNNSFWKICLF